MSKKNKNLPPESINEAIDFAPFYQSNASGMGLPEFNDLCESLKFKPSLGRIQLLNNRMLMTNLRSIASLRRELIETLGLTQARGILTRMGYSAGFEDAEMASKLRAGGDAYDVLTAGPALHAIQGWVAVEPTRLKIDVAAGEYYGEFEWRYSSEVDCHQMYFDTSSDPVCWIQIGYAAGYGSRFMGKRLLYKEIECRGMEHSRCKIVGKPVEEWEDPYPELSYLHPETTSDRVQTKHNLLFNFDQAEHELATSPLASFGGMIGASPGFINTCHKIQKVADTNATVLFLGETGVGKERFARTLHMISNQAEGPFVAVNCAAIPDSLIEAELFGVNKGAFTGASESRAGKFEQADGGSIFLDELGSLSLSAQGKLLRILQDRVVERLGGGRSKKIDIRVIAATNADLRENVKQRKFRQDLWYRINVFPVEIPSLRERRDDIPLLLEYFVKLYNKRHNRTVKSYTQRAIDALQNYSYPGNIRELENLVERAVILASKETNLDLQHLFTQGEHIPRPSLSIAKEGKLRRSNERLYDDPHLDQTEKEIDLLVSKTLAHGTSLHEVETKILLVAVDQANGNLAQAARSLGLTRRQLAHKVSKIND